MFIQVSNVKTCKFSTFENNAIFSIASLYTENNNKSENSKTKACKISPTIHHQIWDF